MYVRMKRVHNIVIVMLSSFLPGPNPTKHDSPNFTHICKILSQMCVKFLSNLWQMNFTNEYLRILVSLIKPILLVCIL
jgi:hypothetical protein